jgi:hypothetical protein
MKEHAVCVLKITYKLEGEQFWRRFDIWLTYEQ